MNIKLYFYTISYLKLSQIVWRLYYAVFHIKVKPYSQTPLLRNYSKDFIKPIEKSIKMLGPTTFRFLNTTYKIQSAEDWNNAKCTKLWLYNLHYFDDLNSKNAAVRKKWHEDLINTWINDNPQGFGNGWEPYPTSLRIVNWIKWGLSGNVLNNGCLCSLATQARYLRKKLEYHLLGNHLFTNAKALIYAGLFFSGQEADEWLNKGQQIVAEQLKEQILRDGGNFERSPMYHAIFLEDLLDIINIFKCYNIDIDDNLKIIANNMLGWLICMTHPNGEYGFFNDTANGIAATIAQLSNYYTRLGLLPPNVPNIVYLANTGYVRIAKEQIFAIIDIGDIGPDYIPGHAHADSLSFELSIGNQKAIVNSGTSLYGNCDERLRQRGTHAHSTLVIDGQNSSEVWAGFRVGRRAKIVNPKVITDNGVIRVVASHNGYLRLGGKPMHYREWCFAQDYCEVMDRVEGKGVHNIEIIYHLAPNIIIAEQTNNTINLFISNHHVKMLFEGVGELMIEKSSYHPEFGVSIETKKIVWKNNNSTLPFNAKMKLQVAN